MLGDHLTGVLHQAQQYIHGLELELNRSLAAGEPVEGRLDQPLPDEERLPLLKIVATLVDTLGLL